MARPLAERISNEKNLPTRWTTEENVTWKSLTELERFDPYIWRETVFLTWPKATTSSCGAWRDEGAVNWKKASEGGNTKMRKQNMSSPRPSPTAAASMDEGTGV